MLCKNSTNRHRYDSENGLNVFLGNVKIDNYRKCDIDISVPS